MPVGIRHAIVDHFPMVVFNHQYSLLAKQNFSSGDLVKIIFYRDTFVTVLAKGGELQFIHMHHYKSGADVVYHLLNICDQFNITGASLLIGGMIEIDSDLHREINHYFKNISFDTLPAGYEFADGLKKISPHYFSHLFSIALCV